MPVVGVGGGGPPPPVTAARTPRKTLQNFVFNIDWLFYY